LTQGKRPGVTSQIFVESAKERRVTDAIYVLRNLPGIVEVEQLLERAEQHQNPLWAPELDRAKALVHDVSRRIFGLSEQDTEWSLRAIRAGFEDYNEWEDHFWAESGGDRDVSELGWDVTDGQGEDLRCLPYFHRQIVCVAEELLGPSPNISGVSNEVWQERLTDEVAKWRSEKRSKR
jgi:hypothetical protein